MLAKLNATKPFLIAGAIALASAIAPVAAVNVFTAGPATITSSTHVVAEDDPGGGGCDSNGNCGSGGQNAGPGGVPGGQGCLPGVGCGSGHS